ncbi:Arc family DNA-binding protein [Klebsiella oxytoca]|uniref:Arc family DNA-binding protein n=1 Tax=Klebsiella TaxID=570 RepID=UPI001CCE474C|nr:Arc family DNA-binding protein [Klebsiella oxytoca]MBZ7165169.1 Arc family DNA-binding protein [Klebsiella oxytoca]MCS6025247.1 Arc family DNA-binding protein [Klebsiella pneumoniae subsp. pneumoniae]
MIEKDNPNFVERFTVRMPDGMRDAIAERAKENGRSMNSEIVDILAKSLSSSSLSDEELVYMLEMATEDNISFLSEEDRLHVEPLLMQIAEKLTARIENETSNLRKVLAMLTAVKNPPDGGLV